MYQSSFNRDAPEYKTRICCCWRAHSSSVAWAALSLDLVFLGGSAAKATASLVTGQIDSDILLPTLNYVGILVFVLVAVGLAIKGLLSDRHCLLIPYILLRGLTLPLLAIGAVLSIWQLYVGVDEDEPWGILRLARTLAPLWLGLCTVLLLIYSWVLLCLLRCYRCLRDQAALAPAALYHGDPNTPLTARQAHPHPAYAQAAATPYPQQTYSYHPTTQATNRPYPTQQYYPAPSAPPPAYYYSQQRSDY